MARAPGGKAAPIPLRLRTYRACMPNSLAAKGLQKYESPVVERAESGREQERAASVLGVLVQKNWTFN